MLLRIDETTLNHYTQTCTYKLDVFSIVNDAPQILLTKMMMEHRSAGKPFTQEGEIEEYGVLDSWYSEPIQVTLSCVKVNESLFCAIIALCKVYLPILKVYVEIQR